MYGLHAYLPSILHAACTPRRIRSEHHAGPHENYFAQALAMSRGNVSLVPVAILAARRPAYEHHRSRLMQRKVQCRMQHYTLSLLGLLISLLLARFSQLSALQPLAGPSAGAASAFANQKQQSFTGADPVAACLAALAGRFALLPCLWPSTH